MATETMDTQNIIDQPEVLKPRMVTIEISGKKVEVPEGITVIKAMWYAGQEVVRWFFRVGGAASTIAKSMSAYDMAVSDAVYGNTERYVSRRRLEAMLEHEHSLNVERLAESRGDTTSFFAFADTVSARNYDGTNDCHGWMGVRFKAFPRDQDTQIIVHFRLLDKAATLQQEAIGILGVNLLYGAFFLHHEPDQLVESLHDDLGLDRVEVDMIEFTGIGFRAVDNRLMSLNLVQKGLSRAAMFGPDKKVRLTMTYPMAVGRNFAEILRALDALQQTDGVPLATPANWVPGQDVIVALALNDAQAQEKYGTLDIRLPYLRLARPPKS